MSHISLYYQRPWLAVFSFFFFSAFILLSLVSLAQTIPEEVVVSAQFRDQPVNEMPASISVYSQSELNELLIGELVDVAAYVPGVTAQAQSVNTPTIVIRGISSDESSAQDAPRISIVLNDADISRGKGSLFELYDLQRIEIVRGSNSTLLGVNSAVGAIRVETARPTEDNYGELSMDVGSDNALKFNGFVNLDFDKIRTRLAFYSSQRDGYVDDLEGIENLMGINHQSIRPSLFWDIYDVLTFDLVGTYEKANDTGVAYKTAQIRPVNGDLDNFTALQHGGDFSSNSIFENGTGLERTTRDVNAQFAWQINDELRLQSISHYREYNAFEAADADGSQAWIQHVTEDADGELLSQEFRALFEKGSFSVVGGLSYSEESNSQNVVSSSEEGTVFLCSPLLNQFLPLADPQGNLGLANIPCQNPDGSTNSLTPILSQQLFGVPIAQVPYIVGLENRGERERFSAYFDSSWGVFDEVTVYAGIRYVDESQVSLFAANVPNALSTGVPLVRIGDTAGEFIEGGRKDNTFLPRLAMHWQFSDKHSLYLAWAKGRKSGVTSVLTALDQNFQPLDSINQIPQERLTNIELGMKGESVNGRYRYAGAIFNQSYDNFQVGQFNQSGQLIVSNAGEATNRGLEVEGSIQLNDHLSLRSTATVIDTNIEEGSLAGRRFRLQPDQSASLALRYIDALNTQFDVSANINYSYQSDIVFNDTLQPNEPLSGLPLTQDAYAVANANIGLIDKERGWTATFWVTNLLDKAYLIDAGNAGTGLGIPTYVRAAPRMYGVTFLVGF